MNPVVHSGEIDNGRDSNIVGHVIMLLRVWLFFWGGKAKC